MKTRQFNRLAGLPRDRRRELVLEGLLDIGENVAILGDELERCNAARAFRAARLVHNAGHEEAGKFLVLVDVFRAPEAGQAAIARQFRRAGDHLSKLIYAQMSDYSIGSQSELVKAVDHHRKGLYLDGPNDYDWIFRNELLSERERALYIDLVDAEGSLQWWTPVDYEMPIPVPFSIRLVRDLMSTELLTPAGLEVLEEAWTGFDAQKECHCTEWQRRTEEALLTFPQANESEGTLNASADFITRHWLMPMVELAVEIQKVSQDELVARREDAYQAWINEEFGPFE